MSYEPSNDVIAANSIPHLNYHLQRQSDTFSFAPQYFLSLVPFPAILLALFILLLLGFAAAIFCRCLYNCCTCKCLNPNVLEGDHIRESVVVQAVKKVTSRTGVFRIFLISLISLVIVVCFIWIGDARANAAFQDVQNAINDISNLFNSITSASSTIVDDSALITSISQSAVCTSSSSASSAISSIGFNSSSLSAFADSISSLSSPVDGALNSFVSAIDTIAVHKKSIVVGAFFGLIMFVAILYACGSYFRKTFLFRTAIFFSWWLVLTMSIVTAVIMVLVMGMAGFCMNPSGNILMSMSSTSSMYQILNFFLTCTGTNPFQSSLNSIDSTLADMQDTLNSVQSQVPVACYDQLSVQMTDITTQANIIIADLGCGPLYNFWNNAINLGMCTDGFGGLYVVMVVLYIVTALLYVVMCVSNALYYMYGYDDIHLDIDAAVVAYQDNEKMIKTNASVTGVTVLASPAPGAGVSSQWWVDVETAGTNPMGKDTGDGAVVYHNDL